MQGCPIVGHSSSKSCGSGAVHPTNSADGQLNVGVGTGAGVTESSVGFGVLTGTGTGAGVIGVGGRVGGGLGVGGRGVGGRGVGGIELCNARVQNATSSVISSPCLPFILLLVWIIFALRAFLVDALLLPPCNVWVKKATSSSISLFVCLCLVLRCLLCCVRRPRVVVSLAIVRWANSINPMTIVLLKLFMLFYLCCDNVLGLEMVLLQWSIMEIMEATLGMGMLLFCCGSLT